MIKVILFKIKKLLNQFLAVCVIISLLIPIGAPIVNAFFWDNDSVKLESSEVLGDNLVAILVEKEAYKKYKNLIEQYAIDVQNELDAQVVQVEVSRDISPLDVYEGLASMYFSGLNNDGSKLIGMVLIGDVPIPVVNKNGNLWPTIFPYVDFDNVNYEWNLKRDRFVYKDNGGNQAEIWHGVIRGENLAKFFENNHKFHTGQISYDIRN